MPEISDFHRGDTKSWRVSFPYDITGATVLFRMAKSTGQAAADMQIEAVIDDPAEPLLPTYSAVFTLDSATSLALDAGRYFAEHKILLGDDVATFWFQTIKVLPSVPGPAV